LHVDGPLRRDQRDAAAGLLRDTVMGCYGPS
jgi:hypothetical protein